MMTQAESIKACINNYMDEGMTDKQEIYTKVVDEMGVPRPTVRRVAKDLRQELQEKIDLLNGVKKESNEVDE